MIAPGTITEVVGRLSSGRTSLFTACLAQVTGRGATAALVDVEGVLDPASAAAAGVELSRLLWVRCGGHRLVGLRAADLLVRCPGFALVGLDLGEAATPLSLPAAFRLRFAVERTATALLIAGRRRVVGPAASLVVELVPDRLEWRGPGSVPTRLARVQARVRVLRRRAGRVDVAPTLGFCA